MTLGTALFASVVLVLAVYHRGFRKVFSWIAGISAIGAGIFFLSVYLRNKYGVAPAASQASSAAQGCAQWDVTGRCVSPISNIVEI